MRRVVDLDGFEPTASALSERRSNQMSYRSLREWTVPDLVPREGFEPPTTLLRKQVLYPLSYRGLVLMAGVEPACQLEC